MRRINEAENKKNMFFISNENNNKINLNLKYNLKILLFASFDTFFKKKFIVFFYFDNNKYF